MWYNVSMKTAALLVFLLSNALAFGAQDATPKPAVAPPASMRQMIIPSHGSMLLGVFYLAAGANLHPTAILLHGFPGFEQNLDIAQALRAKGWNVLAMHYRGSWGVKGDFSFEHAAEDADTEIRFLLANGEKYRIDTHRILVLGHSMGGFMAASATAHNPQVSACVLISAWNIGADYETRRHVGSQPPTVDNEAKSLEEDDNLLPLSGTSGLALAREIKDHAQELNFLKLAPSIAPRPVLVITANDGLAQSDHSLVEALRKAGDSHVTEQHWETDHSYSGERQDLSNLILDWAKNNVQH
jgi:pimeloyl-ACP methyl ester carboxylesterase